VAVARDTITKTGAAGWNSGVASANQITTGDGYVEFTAGRTAPAARPVWRTATRARRWPTSSTRSTCAPTGWSRCRNPAPRWRLRRLHRQRPVPRRAARRDRPLPEERRRSSTRAWSRPSTRCARTPRSTPRAARSRTSWSRRSSGRARPE
jgi:hypothetical protein